MNVALAASNRELSEGGGYGLMVCAGLTGRWRTKLNSKTGEKYSPDCFRKGKHHQFFIRHRNTVYDPEWWQDLHCWNENHQKCLLCTNIIVCPNWKQMFSLPLRSPTGATWTCWKVKAVYFRRHLPGQNLINPKLPATHWVFHWGRDKNIQVKRSSVREYSKKQLLGSNKVDYRSLKS